MIDDYANVSGHAIGQLCVREGAYCKISFS